MLNPHLSLLTAGFRLLACVVIFRQQDFVVPLQWWLNIIAVLFAIPEIVVFVHAFRSVKFR